MAILSPEDASRVVIDPQTLSPDDASRVVLDQHQPTTVSDALSSAGSKFAHGVAESPGIIGDLANLLQLGVGKVASKVDEWSPTLKAIDQKYGTTGEAIQDDARAGLGGQNGFDMGSASFANLLRKIGIGDYQPRGDAAKVIGDVFHFAGNSVGAGIPSIIAKGIKTAAIGTAKNAMMREQGGLLEALKQAGIQSGNNAAIGTGAGVGAEGGKEIASELNVGDGSPWTKFLIESAPAIAAGKVTGASLNRLTTTTPDIVNTMNQAGVHPHFPSDVNTNPGVVGNFFSKTLPGVFGAKGSSATNAERTQTEIKDYAGRVLNPTGDYTPTLQEQGTNIQGIASKSIDALRAETDAGYNQLKAVVPANTPVPLTNTSSAISDLVTQASDPQIKAILQTPTFVKYATLLNKPNLSWSDLNLLRQEVGQSLDGAEGTEKGLLNQMYRAVNDDMRSAASVAHPNGLELFNKATQTASDNSQTIKNIRDNIVDTNSPETIPGWLVGQSKKGSTRLDDILNTPELNTQRGDIGRQLLNNQFTGNDGEANLGKFMKYWQTLSPEAQNSLADGPTSVGMSELQKMYDATAKSRALIGQPAISPLQDPAAILGLGGGIIQGIGHMAQGGSGPGLWAAGSMLAAPVGAHAVAKAAQIPSVVRTLATPTTGPYTAGAGQTLGLPAAGVIQNTAPDSFPDVYHPPAPENHSEAPGEPGKVQAWLGSTDRPSATAYITQKLGPQIGAQIAGADDNGYKAALLNLAFDPNYRKQLAGNLPGEPEDSDNTGAGSAGFG